MVVVVISVVVSVPKWIPVRGDINRNALGRIQ